MVEANDSQPHATNAQRHILLSDLMAILSDATDEPPRARQPEPQRPPNATLLTLPPTQSAPSTIPPHQYLTEATGMGVVVPPKKPSTQAHLNVMAALASPSGEKKTESKLPESLLPSERATLSTLSSTRSPSRTSSVQRGGVSKSNASSRASAVSPTPNVPSELTPSHVLSPPGMPSSVTPLDSEADREYGQLAARSIVSPQASGDATTIVELTSIPQEPEDLARFPHLMLQPKTLAELTQDLWDLRMAMLSDSDFYSQQINRLKRRFWGLVGITSGTVALLTLSVGWVIVNFKDSQIRLARYDDAIATNTLLLEELNQSTVTQLIAKVEELESQIPETLNQDLATAKTDITTLKTQVEELETSVEAHDKALSVLVSAFQGLVRR